MRNIRNLKLSRSVLLLAFAGVLPACAGSDEDEIELGQVDRNVIYGTDDRVDVYAHPDPAWRDLARRSIVAMIPNSNLRTSGTRVTVSGSTLQSAYSMCTDQRFLTQPTGGSCSGTLIDDDLVLTAGHCITNASDCSSNSFVFDYYYEAEGRLADISTDDVYRCASIVARRQVDSGADYAVIRLDRPVTGDRVPAEVRRENTPLAVDSEVVLVGFPTGLPLKIAPRGFVENPRASTLDYFEATVDAFGGNSGSGVFDSQRRLVGILVRGETDYIRRGSCSIVNTLNQSSENGEDITYVGQALTAACPANNPASERFCFGQTSGGGYCDACDANADCGTGFSCKNEVCVAACSTDSDCRADHACGADHFCAPRQTRVCGTGGIHTTDACNRDLGLTQACAATEYCQDAACVTRGAGDTCTNPLDLVAHSQRVSGQIDASTTADVRGACGGQGKDKVYRLVLDRPATVTATATGTVDTVLYLRPTCDSQTGEIACSDDATPPGGRGSRVSSQLAAGTYYLAVDTYGAAETGTYELDLAVEYAAACQNACTAGATQCTTGGVATCITGSEGCTVWSTAVACGAGTTCNNGACVANTTNAGETCADAIVLPERSQTVNGTLVGRNNDLRGTCGGAGPEVAYRLNLTQRTNLVAEATGFDSVVYVTTACGTNTAERACNDDATPPGGNGSHVAATLEPGSYYIVVDAYRNAGAYALNLTLDSANCPNSCTLGQTQCNGNGVATCVTSADGCPAFETVACAANETCDAGMCVANDESSTCGAGISVSAANQTIAGDTRNGQAQLRGTCGGNGQEQVYVFDLATRRKVTATVSGFDSVVYLTTDCSNQANQVACNDDATPPGSYGSRITSTLNPGRYYLVVDSYGAGGAYSLNLAFAAP